eukprot:GHRQ01003748.1.p2 GENE.GHRQ01003748.1~~GHRQ01003748.1.p2  ORF type:complete len:115 (+),score=31.87 GHRQ01003748.1:925-1269(+)
MMEMLMDRGSAVDAGNKGGWTALHRAALTGRLPACRLLLRRGAGLNSITKDGRTALHLAALQVQPAGARPTSCSGSWLHMAVTTLPLRYSSRAPIVHPKPLSKHPKVHTPYAAE